MLNTASPIDLLIFALMAFILLSVVVFLVLKAYLSDKHLSNDGAATIYNSQLFEIEKDLEIGTIDEGEFNSAKNEILRRLLNSQKFAVQGIFEKAKKQTPFAIAILIVLSSLGIYGLIGSPFRKDEPIAQRIKSIFYGDISRASPDEIMLVLLEKAKAAPKDDSPHLFMGKLLLDKGQTQDALQSFQAALRRNPKNPETLAEYAGTMFELNGNKIDDEFEAAINAALTLDPKNQSALFYRGRALWLNDKKPEGLSEWRKIYDTVKNNQTTRNDFILRLVSSLSRLDVGPKSENMGGDMAQFGTPEFINSMISRRAEKLNANPADIGLRLSYANVISKTDPKKALSILEAGRTYFAQDAMQKDILEMTINFQNRMGEKQ